MTKEMSLSDKFKSREAELRSVLPENKFYAIRLDGKAFHTFTKQYERPFDNRFMDSMDAAAQFVIDQVVTGALLAYVQSDEITVVFTDKTGKDTQLPFSGKVEKLLSVSASAATGGFMKFDNATNGVPLFDARFTLLEDLGEVLEYMTWRRLDAQKNSVSMAAETLFSHSELKGVGTKERRELLAGTDLERLPEGFYNGRLIVRRTEKKMVEFLDKRTNEMNSVLANVNTWESVPATREATEFEVGSLLRRLTR